MTTAIETIKSTWDSLLGRVCLIGLAVGWVPYTLLGMATAQLQG